MRFYPAPFRSLVDLNKQGRYVGGSNLRHLGFFQTYIEGKTIGDVRATAVFRHCFFFPTQNVQMAEDRLLEYSDPEWNYHGWSNCQPEPGFVYVLTWNAVSHLV